VWNNVRADTLPGRDHGANPVLLAFFAKVYAPRPAHDHDVDGIAERGDTELAVSVERDRAQITLRASVPSDQVDTGRLQFLDRVRQVHIKQLRGVMEALQMVRQPEDRASLRRLICADSLEDAGAVVKAVRADVDLRVCPVD